MQILPYLPPVTGATTVQPQRTSLHPDTFKPAKPTPGIIPGCVIPPMPGSPAEQATSGVSAITPRKDGSDMTYFPYPFPIVHPPVTTLPVPGPGSPITILPVDPPEPITIQLPHPDSPIQ